MIGAAFPKGTIPLPSLINRPQNVDLACELAGISLKLARSPDRDRKTARKRWHVMAILREWGRSSPQIGRLLNRDHTTVLHGIARWQKLQSQDPAE